MGTHEHCSLSASPAFPGPSCIGKTEPTSPPGSLKKTAGTTARRPHPRLPPTPGCAAAVGRAASGPPPAPSASTFSPLDSAGPGVWPSRGLPPDLQQALVTGHKMR